MLPLYFLILIFVLMLILGVPIAIVILLTSAIGLYFKDIPLAMLPQTMINGINSYTLLAIPLYILAGELMNASGVAKRIFDFAIALVGHIKGGLGHVNILASLVFAGISGSATADASGLGRVEIKAMREEGYDIDFSAAITAASSTIGPIIPPSIHMMIYATVAEVPAAALLIAGLVPGLLMGVGLMIAVYLLAASGRVKCPVRSRKPIKIILLRFKEAFLALLAPIIIVGGIIAGIVTPTEAGVIAVVYTFLLGIFYRELNINKISVCLQKTIYSTGVVMFMLAVARIFAWFITIERIPDAIMGFVFSFTNNKTLILFFVDVLLLLMGMIATASANIVLLTPIILPLLLPLGVNPIHIGVVIVFGLVLGIITPPVGTSLYILSEVAQISYERVVKAILIFYIPLILVLFIITYVPQITLFLPKLVGLISP